MSLAESGNTPPLFFLFAKKESGERVTVQGGGVAFRFSFVANLNPGCFMADLKDYK